MAVGETIVEVATVTAPVVGTLGGVWLGYRMERWRKGEEQKAAAEQRDRDRAAAVRAAEHAAIGDVLRTAADWRRDLAATVGSIEMSRREDVEFGADRLLESHTAFGQALFTASVLFSDAELLGRLSNLTALYEDGFQAVRTLGEEAPATPDSAGAILESILDAMRRDLNELQKAAQSAFSA